MKVTLPISVHEFNDEDETVVRHESVFWKFWARTYHCSRQQYPRSIRKCGGLLSLNKSLGCFQKQPRIEDVSSRIDFAETTYQELVSQPAVIKQCEVVLFRAKVLKHVRLWDPLSLTSLAAFIITWPDDSLAVHRRERSKT